MKLLLLVDNISYNKKWGNILNFVKKWFIYYLNNEIIFNNLSQLKIIKLFPKTELILDSKNENMNIENIIKFFSGIIFKNILSNTDLLSLIDTNNDYDNIIIFSLRKVIYCENIYEYIELKHIKNILVFNFDNAKQTQNSSLGSKELIIKKALKNVYEVFLHNNINSFDKMLEIINNRINIINNKLDLLKNYDNLNNLQKLLINMYKLESTVFNNISINQPINTEQLLDGFNTFDISGFVNKDYYMFLKYCFNFIRIKLTSSYNNKIISTSFNDSDKIFKHIFDFYQIVYPKIHNVLKEDNLLFDFKFFDSVNINDIKEKDYDKLLKEKNDTSEVYLNSIISMSNWKDEIVDLNCFGLLLKYNIRKGIKNKNNKNNKNPNLIKYYSIINEYPNIFVSNISNNFISVNDYYQLILNHLIEVPEFTFDLNNFEIIDSYHGNTNIMLPLFINKDHWHIFNKIKRYHLSLINNYLEPYYNSKMDNIYFFILLKSFNTMLLKNSNDLIQLTIYILRTAMQICIDNKYCFNVKHEYDNYFKNLLLSPTTYNFNQTYNEFIIRFIQLIISSKVDVLKIYNDLDKIKEYYISINKEHDNCNYLTLHNDLLKLTLFMDELFKICGFNQLMKIIESTNGMLSNKDSPLNFTVVKNIILKI